jgi:hypothetical protein
MTEICLCHACSCQEILRVATPRQVEEQAAGLGREVASLRTELAGARQLEDTRSLESRRLLDALESSRAEHEATQARCASAERLADEAAHERQNLRAQLQRLRGSAAAHSPTRRAAQPGYTEARADAAGHQQQQQQQQLMPPPSADALSARVERALRDGDGAAVRTWVPGELDDATAPSRRHRSHPAEAATASAQPQRPWLQSSVAGLLGGEPPPPSSSSHPRPRSRPRQPRAPSPSKLWSPSHRDAAVDSRSPTHAAGKIRRARGATQGLPACLPACLLRVRGERLGLIIIKNWLRFPYVSTFWRSRDLQPRP